MATNGGGDDNFTVEHHLDDVVVHEGGNVYLECKINGHPQVGPIWYKNGIEIRFTDRVRFTNKNKWYRVDIDPVVANDHGVYTVVLQNNDRSVFSSACLYVGPPTGRNAALYTYPYSKGSLTLVQPLINVTVHTKQKIDLQAEFSKESSLDDEAIFWYKDNLKIISNERIEINSTPTLSNLHIESANLTDSGIYTVVNRTQVGYISSIAVVEVFDIDIANYDGQMPSIIENLPNTVEVQDDQEVTLICKAKYNANTVVKWFVNNSMIDNKKHVNMLFGPNYVGLKVSPENNIVKGTYSVVFENRISGRTETSVCNVHTNPVTVQRPPVLPGKPMLSALATYGSEVTFHCSFEYQESQFFFVVWHVGNSRVQRTNTRFDIVCRNREYLLRIKKVEPYMAGEVVCELRHFYYAYDPLILGVARCTLSVVPPEFLASEQETTSFEQTRHSTFHTLIPKKGERCQKQTQDPMAPPSTNISLQEAVLVKETPQTTLMELTYCRLEEDVFYYLDVTMRAPSMASAEVTISENHMKRRLDHVRVFTLQWSEPNIPDRTWYALDIEQCGEYVEAGISSSSVFHIKDPVEGKDLRIRIRTASPLAGTKEASISIAPALPMKNIVEPSCTIKNMDMYENLYHDVGYQLGSGTFGRVTLTEGICGDYYASKYVRTITEKAKRHAGNEFDIMRILRHSKVIELIDAFSDNEGYIFVMEYLWGGELFERIVEEEFIQEMDVVTYVRQICEALHYLHSQRIVHMDIKPENIMCLNPNSKQVKLVDFGLARVLTLGKISRVIYGTRDYVSPEVLGYEPLTVACDMWSLGVVTYVMLSGVMPFAGDSWVELTANITRANYNFDDTAFKDISDLGKDFISSLLVCNPKDRMTASQCLSHMWIVTGPPEITRARVMKKTKDNLRSYLASKAKWQRAGNVMIAAHRLRTQANLRSSMDPTTSGT